jgi:hypothetical protein
MDYLLGIIHKACGRRVLPNVLSAAEAGQVLDAIKSRLAAAIRPGNAAPVPPQQSGTGVSPVAIPYTPEPQE